MGWKSGKQTADKKKSVTVPFLDLHTQYEQIKPEILFAIEEVLDSGQYVFGDALEVFEKSFAKAHEARHCISCCNGTAALHLALWASGIKPGDEVIVPTHTFIATAEAVSLCGAVPVFVDIDPETYNIDPKAVRAALTPRTKAIIPVHLYGQPADLSGVTAFAEDNELLLIEDCAQAHLATYHQKKVGTFGAAGCFSFYPGKNLGAYGQGGAVVTNDEALAEKIFALKEHGSLKKYHHRLIGHNYRLDSVQAAVLNIKMRYLEKWTEQRRAHAHLYSTLLVDLPQIGLPHEAVHRKHVYHLYVIRVPDRDRLMGYLESEGIGTAIHYPIPCHLQEAYQPQLCICPEAESAASEIVSLPMYPELTEKQIRRVAEAIKQFYRS